MSISIALDLNVIIVALEDWASLELLSYLRNKNSSDPGRAAKIACDEDEIIREEYNRYLEQRLQQATKTLDVQFLQDLLSQWSTWTTPKQNQLSEDATRFLEEQECTTGAEFQLIALATNSDVILGTVAPDVNHPELQPRVIIQSPEKIQELRQIQPEIQVFSPDKVKALLEYDFLPTLFEGKVVRWIEKKYKYPHTQRNFYPPYLRKASSGGEIDILARDHQSNPQRVLVCECKLRMPGNESNLISDEEVQQIVSTWQAVKEHEESKATEEGYNVKVFAMLVSNANGATDQAITLAKQHRVEIWRVILPENWHRYSEWSIQRCERVHK
ncbi:MAG: hypothetical protein GXN93_05155 [Candidatus Diapherotrites archaeon]|nr:hypothetical protein [Candidatus Diapherotrites archaeon]